MIEGACMLNMGGRLGDKGRHFFASDVRFISIGLSRLHQLSGLFLFIGGGKGRRNVPQGKNGHVTR